MTLAWGIRPVIFPSHHPWNIQLLKAGLTALSDRSPKVAESEDVIVLTWTTKSFVIRAEHRKVDIWKDTSVGQTHVFVFSEDERVAREIHRVIEAWRKGTTVD